MLDLVIEGLGAGGDGVAGKGPERVFVPQALPGERVRAVIESASAEGRRARLIEVLEASPQRQEPKCSHFGACGGCALQHLADDSYVGFKLARLMGALGQRGFKDVPLAAPRRVPRASRRRVRLAATRGAGTVTIGFRAARGHAVIDIERCPIVVPAIEQIIAPLRGALPSVLEPRTEIEIAITATATGLDVVFIGITAPSAESRVALAALARSIGLARLSIAAEDHAAPEIIAVNSSPTVRPGGIDVALPPDAFIQPTAEGEAAIVEEVLSASKRVKRAADLFSGLGTIALPLAGRGIAVEAYDSSTPATAALDDVARHAEQGGRLKATRQDLMRAPLPPTQLKAFDLVVFDPPRLGAEAQATQLARSRVPAVVAVSCNPATFARDARILVDGGYRLERVTPLDQFLWTPHLELIASFRR